MIIHQHSSFPGQLTQAGFHTIFHKVLSVVRRDLMWGFLQVQEEAILQGLQYTQTMGWGIWRQSQGHCTGMIPTARWGSCSCSSTGTFSGLALSPKVCKKQRTQICNFQVLKEEFHPDKMKFTWTWVNTVTVMIISQGNIWNIFKGVHTVWIALLVCLSQPQQQGQLSWSSS